MWSCLLPASCATIVALSLPYAAAAPIPAQGPPAPSVAEQQEKRQTMKSEGVDLQRQISDLQGLAESVKQRLTQRKAQRPPAGGVSGQQAMPGAPEQQASLYSQQQDRELHSELQDLIPQLKRELQLDEQSVPPSDVAEQQRRQSSLDAFKDVVADLQGEDSELQTLIAQGQEEPKQRDVESSPGSELAEQQPAHDALEHQAVDLRSDIADLQQQLATQKQELARTMQELTHRAHELDEARSEADVLRQEIDRLRQRRQAEEALLALQRAQEQMAAALPPRPAATKPAPRPAQPLRPATDGFHAKPAHAISGAKQDHAASAAGPADAHAVCGAAIADCAPVVVRGTAGRGATHTDNGADPDGFPAGHTGSAVSPGPQSLCDRYRRCYPLARHGCQRPGDAVDHAGDWQCEPAGEREPRRQHEILRWACPRLVWISCGNPVRLSGVRDATQARSTYPAPIARGGSPDGDVSCMIASVQKRRQARWTGDNMRSPDEICIAILLIAAFGLIATVAVRVNTEMTWLNWVGFAAMAGFAGYAWWRALHPPTRWQSFGM